MTNVLYTHFARTLRSGHMRRIARLPLIRRAVRLSYDGSGLTVETDPADVDSDAQVVDVPVGTVVLVRWVEPA